MVSEAMTLKPSSAGGRAETMLPEPHLGTKASFQLLKESRHQQEAASSNMSLVIAEKTRNLHLGTLTSPDYKANSGNY